MYDFAHKSNISPLEVVPTFKIFAKDPHMRLKRKKLGLTIDLKKDRRYWSRLGPWRPREEKRRIPFASYERGMTAAPQKRKQAARLIVYSFVRSHQHFPFTSSGIIKHVC